MEQAEVKTKAEVKMETDDRIRAFLSTFVLALSSTFVPAFSCFLMWHLLCG